MDNKTKYTVIIEWAYDGEEGKEVYENKSYDTLEEARKKFDEAVQNEKRRSWIASTPEDLLVIDEDDEHFNAYTDGFEEREHTYITLMSVDESNVSKLFSAVFYKVAEKEIDYVAKVISRVENEYESFQAHQFADLASNVFFRAYEIYVKTRMMEVITDFGYYLDEEDYKALYSVEGNLLQLLYNAFRKKDSSIESYKATSSFIKDYIESLKE